MEVRKRPWKFDPQPSRRDGHVYVTRKCPVCLTRKFRWAEEVCYDCLDAIKKSNPEEDLG